MGNDIKHPVIKPCDTDTLYRGCIWKKDTNICVEADLHPSLFCQWHQDENIETLKKTQESRKKVLRDKKRDLTDEAELQEINRILDAIQRSKQPLSLESVTKTKKKGMKTSNTATKNARRIGRRGR